MGHRELRRVPLDFDWPRDKVWKGYLNPYSKPCPGEGTTCFNGYTAGRKWLQAVVHLLMMLRDDRKDRPLHPWLQELPLRPEVRPSDDIKALTEGLAGRAPSFLGHDGIDNWTAESKIIKAAGLPKTWGICPICKGHAIDPELKKKHDRWKPKDPPKGEGFQLWETCSEGSPVSPVFESAEQLAEWCESHATTFASERTSKENWLRMFQEDSVDAGSMLIARRGYFGSLANDPERKAEG